MMKLQDNVKLGAYEESARKEFSETQTRLSEIEGSFRSRMDGKSIGSLVGSLIGTLFWLGAFLVGAYYARKTGMNELLLKIAFYSSMALILAKVIDVIVNFSYYGKVNSYLNEVRQLQNRVGSGEKAMRKNQEAFQRAKEKGWDYRLKAASSVPGEVKKLLGRTSALESLNKGFLNGLKNFLFFVTVIAVAAAGCLALFPFLTHKIITMTHGAIEVSTLHYLLIAAAVIVGIFSIILARLIWSKTDCEVTNVTLLAMPIAPAVFLILVLAVAAIVYYFGSTIINVVSIIVKAVVVIAIIGVITTCTNGG